MKGVAVMRVVTEKEFIDSPAQYLEIVEAENVQIIKDGRAVAILAKPSDTPIADSLLGLLKGAGISSIDDIKAIKVKA